MKPMQPLDESSRGIKIVWFFLHIHVLGDCVQKEVFLSREKCPIYHL